MFCAARGVGRRLGELGNGLEGPGQLPGTRAQLSVSLPLVASSCQLPCLAWPLPLPVSQFLFALLSLSPPLSFPSPAFSLPPSQEGNTKPGDTAPEISLPQQHRGGGGGGECSGGGVLSFSRGHVAMATVGHSIYPILGKQGSKGNDSQVYKGIT